MKFKSRLTCKVLTSENVQVLWMFAWCLYLTLVHNFKWKAIIRAVLHWILRSAWGLDNCVAISIALDVRNGIVCALGTD